MQTTNPILAAFLREKKKKEDKKPAVPRTAAWKTRRHPYMPPSQPFRCIEAPKLMWVRENSSSAYENYKFVADEIEMSASVAILEAISSVTAVSVGRWTSSSPGTDGFYRYLDFFAIGQKHAKKVFAVGVYHHYRRLLHNIETRVGAMHQRECECTGGTFTVTAHVAPLYAAARESLASTSNPSFIAPLRVQPLTIRDVSMALCDCTSMTQAGYVGEDVQSAIEYFFLNELVLVDENIAKAEQGIFFLDETDKRKQAKIDEVDVTYLRINKAMLDVA
ncbi:hypothetical protein RB195_005189 [Necator americanus]|uniref:Uncharacterized protein n=1 Tax=Necator americanus TaxID=51031 RepID=A0ABR1BPW0_NECAM